MRRRSACAPDRVQVVPHGLPAGFASGPVDEDALRARYHLHGPFFLYPAVTYPHKNHLLLLGRAGPAAATAPTSSSC